MAFSDARNERDRAAGDTSGKSSGGGGDRARQAEARNREAMSRGQAGMGSGSFRGGGPMPKTRDQMMAQDAMGARVAKALGDYKGVGDSMWDKAWNKVASFLGAEEEDPSLPGFSAPGMPGITGRANWSWDPVTAVGNVGSTVAGIPLVGSLIQGASSLTGRPAAVPLGPDFFGPSPTRPDLPYDAIGPDFGAQVSSALSNPFGSTSSQPQYGSPATPQNPNMAGVHPTGTPPAGGSQGQGNAGQANPSANPGLAANPSQQNPALAPMPAPQTIAPVPKPPKTATPYGWGQVSLPQNYFMSQMT